MNITKMATKVNEESMTLAELAKGMINSGLERIFEKRQENLCRKDDDGTVWIMLESNWYVRDLVLNEDGSINITMYDYLKSAYENLLIN